METVYRDYRDKGVQFFYVYKSVQHPEINNFVSAFSIEERLRHIDLAKQRLQTEIPWICDTMDGVVKRTFGGAPNGEFVLDPEGKIVRKRFWSDPRKLRADLVELVGPVQRETTVAELPTRFVVESRTVAHGVVPRLKLPSGLRPLKIEPVETDLPFFAKLRAEATRSLLKEAAGKLYLVVYLDPLYQVHWNNRAERVAIEIKAPKHISLSERSLSGPEVQVDADIDPREFLIDVEGAQDEDSLIISLSYTACDDAETFCTPITQTYDVHFQSHRDLGSRPGIFMPSIFAQVTEFDTNQDGDLTPEELPAGKVTLYIGHMDYDGDEIIQAAEIETFMSMFNNGRGFDSTCNDGELEEDDEK